MSQSAAKAIRRDLRRAVGTRAVSVLDRQAEALSFMGQGLSNQTDRLDHATTILADQRVTVSALDASLRAHLDEFDRTQLVTFADRLRWLFTGRCPSPKT